MNAKDFNFGILGTLLSMHALAFYAVSACPITLDGVIFLTGVTLCRWLGFSCAVHRYFAHRVCRTSRWFQFILGVWGTLTMARSPIKFASGHRHHHLYSDRNGDLHSPKHDGLLGAYVGWVVSKRYNEKNLGHVSDLERYPELIWLNKLYFAPNLVFFYVLYVAGGATALTYGGLVSVILTWHMAFSVTVLFHFIGTPTYETGDDSKNSAILGVLMCGEGWHNNHHANSRSCRLGHEWWQLDLGYVVFLGLEKIGLVWSLNKSVGPGHSGVKRVKSSRGPIVFFGSSVKPVDKLWLG